MKDITGFMGNKIKQFIDEKLAIMFPTARKQNISINTVIAV